MAKVKATGVIEAIYGTDRSEVKPKLSRISLLSD